MEQYRVDSLEDITQELVLALIERYQENEVERLEILESYYEGRTAIHDRTMKDADTPNNKLAAPHATYIVDTTQGYFLGKPISYTSLTNTPEDVEFVALLQGILDNNDESAHNTKVMKEAAITGVGYELVYLGDDEDKSIKIDELDPKETFVIWDNSIDSHMLAAVRFYTNYDYITDTETMSVEVYGPNMIKSFDVADDESSEVTEIPHNFGEVPVVMYNNNDENTGDFEKVKDLIDGYDQALSDTANNIEYFADSYLHLAGLKADPEDVATMKDNRVLVSEEGGSVEWVTKSTANQELEEHKERLKEDIHMLSHVPRLDDSAFGTSTSGDSLRYKMLGIENLVSIKERLMKKALQKRIRLIVNMLSVKGSHYDANKVAIKFTRNLPTNTAQIVDSVTKLNSLGLISDETLLSMIPDIEDPAKELEKTREKQAELYNNYLPEVEKVAEEGTIPGVDISPEPEVDSNLKEVF